MISEDVIQRVKEENDIVDVISETVKLKRAGRNYSGLCPFHHEKTPSFSVSIDKQIYKCFGCGEAGNVITFVMKTKNLSFPEAVRLLANRVNITIETDENNVHKDTFKQLYKLNVDSARYFFNCLGENANAKQYLLNRGITEKTIRSFGLGYSANSWDGLLRHLKKKGFTELDMLSNGLIIKSQKGSYYDRFRNRIIFPVFDYRGRVIGFGGRVMDDSKPKYLNSPETTLFKKGVNLYGLNFAIKNNRERMLIIVEGYMDCISLHQYGITNAVASLGTALTTNQAKLIKKYADSAIIAYDADSAGQMATMRGLEILKKVGLDVKVLKVPEGKDPDEYIRNNGKEAFIKLIEEALPLVDYRIKKIKENIDFNNSEGVIKYAEQALEIISDLDAIEREIYIKKLSEETGIRDQALYDMINTKIQKNVKKSENMNIDNDFGQKLYLEPAYLKAERGLLKAIFKDEKALEYVEKSIKREELILESHRKIYDYIVENMQYDEEERRKRIEVKCDDIDTSKEWVNIIEADFIYDSSDYENIVDDYIRGIKKFKLEESKKQIMNRIKQYEIDGKLEESLKLAQELIQIQKKIGGM
ncbi:DNA primase [Clostridium carboxidivorans P7]|uniref:DNA primase n=1 Tax=Clostridium carboxidivorans P7 TaxID=536227 RepID=C6PTX8_9CLOT|nr:DNA primase [Clostridium carboxidivorans]AKN33661.1 DNA primase [Clostridium carboxidivorans P7]EET87277.1 DNA primase [Clostridium carboxidivorans P7]EFG86741.1 DNA primase [Clostridium carboxidivorans P7]